MDKKLIKRNIFSSEITKHLLKSFFKLVYNNPNDMGEKNNLIFNFLFRFGRSSFSLWDLFFPKTNKELLSAVKEFEHEVEISDPTSISAILRGLYESYLILRHLTEENITTEEFNLRSLAWLRNGANTKFTLAGTFKLEQSFLIKTEKEFKEIDEKLINNELFKASNKKLRTKLLNDGISKNPYKLSMEFGISKELHTFIYKQTSSHIHPDSHGFQQIGHIDWKEINNINRHIYLYVSVLMLDYVRKYIFKSEIGDDIDLLNIIEAGLETITYFDNN